MQMHHLKAAYHVKLEPTNPQLLPIGHPISSMRPVVMVGLTLGKCIRNKQSIVHQDMVYGQVNYMVKKDICTGMVLYGLQDQKPLGA